MTATLLVLADDGGGRIATGAIVLTLLFLLGVALLAGGGDR